MGNMGKAPNALAIAAHDFMVEVIFDPCFEAIQGVYHKKRVQRAFISD